MRQALEKNPENAFAYSQQAKIYFSMKQPQQARAAITKALQLQPYQPDFLSQACLSAIGESVSVVEEPPEPPLSITTRVASCLPDADSMKTLVSLPGTLSLQSRFV